MEYSFEIVSLLVSPAHAYFGRPKDGPAVLVQTSTPEQVEIVADKGIRGDRFFGVRAHTEAAVTFLALEAWQAAAGDVDPSVARRNVVVRGLELDPLRAHEFTINSGSGPIRFRGGRPAHPCSWMDTVAGEGVRKALIGRGGLRTQPLTSGVLHVGPAVLTADVDLDAARAADQVKRAQPLR
ncbi:molybdenum cofactor biosysynthesis protein [Gordonia sp. Z-3]|uniref:Molybdenum cofactor biosysynthesis protein n=2 Tax=Gordonia TaxID=2053 RepID=A0A9X3D0L1_9ACTN|nr:MULTISPECIES: molybdenum cofactor biosysynthesis protein [Gordonia]MAU83996.1 molybdenum cofactor biosysynthesis protein [Gordonia sp. (in: high G+C Gram-positive bacteria)]MCF3940749.1 molybdenum cofactor biosysynthesis protein [Gordonia tangerina]MCX2962829.1 molybdenum cofactor biosysynthesis protein [Gordonia aquimaris]MED5799968.1 molybdenum cofactor biosysynthesis protein [Gordonia sp. Z-3]